MDHLLAVILGGGAGSRLHPLTLHRSKPAVPLAGKYRLIDVPVSNCINSGISRIFVLTQYNSASLNRHIASTYHFDRFRRGFVSVLAAEQTPSSNEWFQGTADAVRRSMPHLQVYNHSYILILAGDQLYRMDYRELLAHHREHNADLTIGTIPVTAAEAPAFGILKTDANGVITEFHEKPPYDQLEGKQSRVSAEMEAKGRVFLASMGIYIFNKEILNTILEEHPCEYDFGRQLIPRAIEKYRVISFPFTGYWSDIGTIRSFYEAHMDLTQKIPAFDMYSSQAPMYTNARMLPPAKIQFSEIENSLIGEASIIINSRITNSIIGIRSYLGYQTTIRDSVLAGATYFAWQDPASRFSLEGPPHPGVDAYSIVERAIIDRNASIGRGCRIVNRDHVQEGEGPNFCIRDGIIVIPKNAIIEDGTEI